MPMMLKPAEVNPRQFLRLLTPRATSLMLPKRMLLLTVAPPEASIPAGDNPMVTLSVTVTLLICPAPLIAIPATQ